MAITDPKAKIIEFFHNSHLIRRIQQSEIYKNLRCNQGLNLGSLLKSQAP